MTYIIKQKVPINLLFGHPGIGINISSDPPGIMIMS